METFQRARSEEQRRIRRQAILDTAAEMLDEMPVGKVSLNELSRRTGLAKSNVLRYFESREAVLLELLDRAWQQWTADLRDELASGMDANGTARERGDRFAAVLTELLTRHRVFCDLLSAQAGVLEHNVSPDVAARYKRAAMGNARALASLVGGYLPEVGDRAERLCSQAFMMIGAVWTHARPSGAMLAAYEADPSLAAMRIEFAPTLRDALVTLIAGNLRPES